MGEKQKNNRKKMTAFFVALFFASAIFLLSTSKAHAGPIDMATDAFSTAIKLILYQVFVFFGWIAGAAAVLFAWVIDAKNISGADGVLNNAAVTNVWVMVRDTLNLAFIMVLLFAAFCTIFQVEKWNLKKVWLNILINALLVNFSFTIARFIIDISNVMMYYFFSHMFQSSTAGAVQNGSSIMSSIGGVSGIANVLIPEGVSTISDQPFAFIIAAIVFMFIFAVTLLVIAIMFVIRMVALVILVMFSPIGFVGYIFPATHKFADDWWTNLFKYAFFGPIMAFMMSVALQMLVAFSSTKASMKELAQGNIPNNGSMDAAWFVSFAFFSVPIIILWIALGVSQSMGVAGASAVVGKAKGFSQWAGKTPIMAGAHKFDRDVLAGKLHVSPRTFIAAWKQKTKDKDDKVFGPETGRQRDRLTRAMSFGRNSATGKWGFQEKSHYKDMEEEKVLGTELKEMESYATNDEFLVDEIKSLRGKKDSRSQAKTAAAVRMLFKNNDQNEFMQKLGMAGDGTKGSGDDRDPFATRKALSKLFDDVGMSPEQKGRNLYQLGEIGLSKGNFGDYGMGEFKDGKYQESTDASQQAAAVGKFANLGSQEKMKTIHWNAILTQKKDGSVGDVHETGEAFLNKITASEIKQADRSRADFLEKMGADSAGRASLVSFMNSTRCENKENVKELLKRIDELNDKSAAAGTAGGGTPSGGAPTPHSGIVDQYGNPI